MKKVILFTILGIIILAGLFTIIYKTPISEMNIQNIFGETTELSRQEALCEGIGCIIENDSVYIDDENAFIQASPHTMDKSGWVEFEVMSKNYDGNINAIWGFDTEVTKPTKAQYYNPTNETWNTSNEMVLYNVTNYVSTELACDYGNEYNNIHQEVTYDKKDYLGNITNHTTEVFCFDSYTQNGSDYNISWETKHWKMVYWHDFGSQLGKIERNLDGKDTWYYISNFDINANQSYKVRAYMNVRPNSNGKYDFAVYPSSYGSDVVQAYNDGNLYLLDPWYDSDYDERYPHNDNSSGFNGIGYFGANLTGWYGTIDGGTNTSTYHNSTTGASLVANATDELCWFNTTSGDANCPIKPNGLVAYYPLDGSSGDVWSPINESLNGTISGAVRDSDGRVNDSFYFNDYADEGNLGSVFGSSADTYSIAFWVNMDSDTENGGLIGSRNTKFTGFLRVANSDFRFYNNDEILIVSGDFTGQWLHVVGTYNGTHTFIYLNGTHYQNGTDQSGTNSDVRDFLMGRDGNGGNNNEFLGKLDDIRFYDRYLNSTEVSNLHSSTSSNFPYLEEAETEGGGGAPTDNPPSVTLNSPVDTFNTTSQSITFNCTASDDINLTNVTLYIDGSANETNSSGINNTNYIFTKTLNDGFYGWTCEATDNSSQTTKPTSRNFTIDSTPPEVAIISPIDYSTPFIYNETNSIWFNVSANDSVSGIDDCEFYLDEIESGWTSMSNDSDIYYYQNTSVPEGEHTIYYKCTDNFANENDSESQTFYVDTIAPQFTTIPANQTIEYGNDFTGVDFDATDSGIGISTWNISDTTNFTINSTGYLDNATQLDVHTYKVNVSVNDHAGNVNWTMWQLKIEDTTAPQFTTIPADESFNNETDWSGVDFDATDLSGISTWFVNDTDFTINSTGYLDNNTENYNAGTYVINVSVNDSEGNTNSTIYKLTATSYENIEVTLNSPADGAGLGTTDVTFNATATTTRNYLENMSLWTNESGSWTRRATMIPWNTFSDNFNDNSLDDTKWSNSTTTEAGSSASVEEQNNRMELTATSNLQDTSDISGIATLDTVKDIVGFSFEVTSLSLSVNRGSNINDEIEEVNIEILIGSTVIIDKQDYVRGGAVHSPVWTAVYDDLTQNTIYSLNLTSNGNWTLYENGSALRNFSDLSGDFTLRVKTRADTTVGAADGSASGTIYIDNFNAAEKVNENDFTVDRTYSTGDNILWNVQTCDDSGECNFSTSNFTFSIDSQIPTVNIGYPNETIDYGSVGDTEDLNFTATDDSGVESCWYNYNGTNISLPSCNNGTFTIGTFTIEDFGLEQNITIYANDTAGNVGSDTVSFDYRIFNNGVTFNSTNYHTAQEKYSINVSANSSLTNVILQYNGTEYTTTQSGSIWSRTLNLGSDDIGNNSIRWKFTYAGNTIYSDYSYQDVQAISFGLCNGTLTDNFLVFDFKDEDNSSNINAEIPTSSFVYYLGDGIENKTYNYINNTANSEYQFCFIPTDRTVYVDMRVQYKNDNHPQRVYEPSTQTLTNASTNKTLYLLGVNDGQYVTFQFINLAEQPISGVDVTVTREIGGTDEFVGTGTTDDAGSITFWLNPNYIHTISYSKTGYESGTTTITPTNTEYTITLNAGLDIEDDYTRGISISLNPTDSFLDEFTNYNFSYELESNYWEVERFGYKLYFSNGTRIDLQSASTNGGTLSSNNINVSNVSYVYMSYYYTINDTNVSSSRNWYIQSTDGRDYSIYNFATNLDTHIEDGLFGIGDFGRILIVVVILVMTIGGVTLRYGIKSEPMALGILFGLVLILENVLGLVPQIEVGSLTIPNNFLSGIMFVLLLAVIVREEYR